jgi:hypothetical protein
MNIFNEAEYESVDAYNAAMEQIDQELKEDMEAYKE